MGGGDGIYQCRASIRNTVGNSHKALTQAVLTPACSFPEMCLSLALVSVPPPTEYVRGLVYFPRTNSCFRLPTYFTSIDELVRMWGLAENLEDFEHANMELIELTVGRVCYEL